MSKSDGHRYLKWARQSSHVANLYILATHFHDNKIYAIYQRVT